MKKRNADSSVAKSAQTDRASKGDGQGWKSYFSDLLGWFGIMTPHSVRQPSSGRGGISRVKMANPQVNITNHWLIMCFKLIIYRYFEKHLYRANS